MEKTLTITTNKSDVRKLIAKLPEAVRVECDKLFVTAKDADAAITNAHAAESPLRATLARINHNEAAIKEAGFKNFGEFAEKVFGLPAQQATQAAKVGEKFDLSEKKSPLVEWFSFYGLYELRDVDMATLDADVKSGVLHKGMTQKELRAYNAAHKLESGAVKLVKMYEAHIVAPSAGESVAFKGTYEEILDKMRDICRTVNGLPGDFVIDEDRFGAYNPHVSFTSDKGKVTDAKGVFLGLSSFMMAAWYVPVPAQRKRKESPQAAWDSIKKLTPEQRAELLKQLSQYDPAEDDEIDEGDPWDAGLPMPGTAGDPFTP